MQGRLPIIGCQFRFDVDAINTLALAPGAGDGDRAPQSALDQILSRITQVSFIGSQARLVQSLGQGSNLGHAAAADMLHRFVIHRRQRWRCERLDVGASMATQFCRLLDFALTQEEAWSLAGIDKGEGLTRLEAANAENRGARSVLAVVDVEEEAAIGG